MTLRAFRRDGRAVIEVEDNGVGMLPDRAGSSAGSGIGLRNVSERLRVVYGTNSQFDLRSTPGAGTTARIVIPDATVAEPASA